MGRFVRACVTGMRRSVARAFFRGTIVGESQSVLAMINPMIDPMTRKRLLGTQPEAAIGVLEAMNRHRGSGVSPQRPPDEPPWLQFTGTCQRFWPPPRLNN
eukprot:COSAG01_NODE_476_length_16515_cov_37.730690_11_plen_101_part_00